MAVLLTPRLIQYINQSPSSDTRVMQRAYTHSNRLLKYERMVKLWNSHVSACYGCKLSSIWMSQSSYTVKTLSLPIWEHLGVLVSAEARLHFFGFLEIFVWQVTFCSLTTLYNACKGLRMHYSMLFGCSILALEIRNPVVRIVCGIRSTCDNARITRPRSCKTFSK